MHRSKVPLGYWYVVVRALIEEKVSTKDIQRFLQYKRYEPIWKMCNEVKNKLVNHSLINDYELQELLVDNPNIPIAKIGEEFTSIFETDV